jgi:hypothetical protein
VNQGVFFIFSSFDGDYPMIKFIIKLPSIIFNKKSSTRDIVLPYIFYGRGLPFLTKGSLIDSTFDFMIVFEISLFQIDALHEMLFGNRIRGTKFARNSF